MTPFTVDCPIEAEYIKATAKAIVSRLPSGCQLPTYSLADVFIFFPKGELTDEHTGVTISWRSLGGTNPYLRITAEIPEKRC